MHHQEKLQNSMGNDIEWINSDNINTPYHFITQAEESLSQKGKKRARIVRELLQHLLLVLLEKDELETFFCQIKFGRFNQQINAIIPNEEWIHILLLA